MVHFGAGAIRYVGEILDALRPDGVFLVTGQTSYTGCGAAAALRPMLGSRPVRHFRIPRANPELADIERGLTVYGETRDPVILAVGGGSVLDTAKLIAVFSAQTAAPHDIVYGGTSIATAGPPVIAVPTTAGTGAEATHFAVVYAKGTKFSVAHESIRPRYAVVDPELTHSAPPTLTAVTGFDAFGQAIESLWSVHSTAESAAYAREALQLARDNLWRAVHAPSAAVRHAMSKAAHLAGRAINIARTTAPHALSYAMTSHFGVPHGQAVALTLGEVLAYNSRVTVDDVVDHRGAAYVRQVMAEIQGLVGGADAATAREQVAALTESVGLATRLREVGIRTPADRELLVVEVNGQRLANNPRALPVARLREVIDRIA